MDLSIFFRAEILGDDNAYPTGNTNEKTDHHHYDRADGADCRKCLVAHIISDDPGIYCIVELLEQVPKHQRNCKTGQMWDNTPFRHICCF